MSAFGQTEETPPVVHAVLLYSSSCPHCHYVITEVLPPLGERFGNRLQIFLINVQGSEGQDIFWNAVDQFEIPPERQGVPLLVVGEEVLVGGNEIPERFPTLIEEGIEKGGIPWPEIPGLKKLMDKSALTATAVALTITPSTTPSPASPSPTIEETETPFVTATSTPQPTQTPIPDSFSLDNGSSGILSNERELSDATWVEKVLVRVRSDPFGNLVSILVFIGMVASLISIGIGIWFPQPVEKTWPDILIPLLSLAGVGVAGYLSYIEMTNTIAICGPVGDCNTVQQSQYARIGGVFPVGLLGLLGSIAIAGVWFVYRRGPEKYQKAAAFSLWGMTLFGTLFAAYLTFLEPFVIGATCAWCLASSLIITAQLWIATAMVDKFRKDEI